jgi:hypothetical protein
LKIFLSKPRFRSRLILRWLWRLAYSYALAFLVINVVVPLLNRQGAEPLQLKPELIIPAIPIAFVFFVGVTIYRLLSRRLQTGLILMSSFLFLAPPILWTLTILLSPGKSSILAWFISFLIVGGIYYILWGRTLLFALGQYSLAIGNINLWMRLRPRIKASLHVQRANCQYFKQDFESAHHDLEQALMLEPYNFELLVPIALLYIDMGDYQKALKLVESKLDSLELPNKVEFQLLNIQIWVYLLLGDYGTAYVLCDVLSIESPKMLLPFEYRSYVLHKRGIVSLLRGNYPDALKQFDTALSTAEKDVRLDVLLGLAITYHKLDDLHKSEDMWFKIDVWYPQWDIDEFISLKSTIPAMEGMLRASYELAHL